MGGSLGNYFVIAHHCWTYIVRAWTGGQIWSDAPQNIILGIITFLRNLLRLMKDPFSASFSGSPISILHVPTMEHLLMIGVAKFAAAYEYNLDCMDVSTSHTISLPLDIWKQ